MKSYIGIDEFLARIVRDFGIDSLDKFNVLEWVSEGISAMGARPPTADRSLIVTNVNDYTVTLPQEVYSIVQIGKINEHLNVPTLWYADRQADWPGSLTPVYKNTATLQGASITDSYEEVTDHILRFSFSGKSVVLLVESLATDREGLPMIPGDYDSLNALAYFVAMKTHLKDMYMGKSNNYEYFRQLWVKHLQQAVNRQWTPDLADLENLSLRERRFFSENDFANFFSGVVNAPRPSSSSYMPGGYLKFGINYDGCERRTVTVYGVSVELDCRTDNPPEDCNRGYCYLNGDSLCYQDASGWQTSALNTYRGV